MDCFGDVGDGDGLCVFQVGDGAGDLKDAVVSAGAEALLLHGAFEQALGVGGELAEGADLLGVHVGVGENARWADGVLWGWLFAKFQEALVLEFASGEDAGADFGGAFGCGAAAELFVLHGGNFDVNVDAIEERSGDLADVPLDHRWGTHAVA